MTDALGYRYEYMLYLPFGEAMAQQKVAGWATPYTFTGKEVDGLTGLHYFGARYLDSRLSIWFGVDPLAGKYPYESPFTYVSNNPIRYNDPTGMEKDDIIIRGLDGSEFNWTAGSTYDGDDKFIQESVAALDALTEDPKTANFSFKGKQSSGVNFEGNAVLDYASGGSKDHQDIIIEHANNNPEAPGQNQHIKGIVYWDPSRGIKEEGFYGGKGGGSFPSMGLLIHEMGHAALYNEFGGADWRDRQHIFGYEEQMIIDRLEKPAMQSLGFGYRTGHNTKDNRTDLLKNDFSGSQHYKLPFVGSYYILSLTPTKLK